MVQVSNLQEASVGSVSHVLQLILVASIDWDSRRGRGLVQLILKTRRSFSVLCETLDIVIEST